MTIDVLILETLASGKITTVKELSETWGEDFTRVYEWLVKFEKLGLCKFHPMYTRKSKWGQIAYLGDPTKIAIYLETRKNGTNGKA